MATIIKRTKQGIHALLSKSEYEFVSRMDTIVREKKPNKLIAIEVMAKIYPKALTMRELLPLMKEAGAVFASRSPLKALGVTMNQYGETFKKVSRA